MKMKEAKKKRQISEVKCKKESTGLDKTHQWNEHCQDYNTLVTHTNTHRHTDLAVHSNDTATITTTTKMLTVLWSFLPF